MPFDAHIGALLAVNRAITGALDHEGVLRLVVEKTAELLGSRACVLLLAGADRTARVVASVGVSPELTRAFSAPLDEQIHDAVCEALDIHPEDLFLGVPVVIRGRVEGILAVFRRGAEPGADEEAVLSALADQASIALDNADRFEALRDALHAREQAEAELTRAHAAERHLRRRIDGLARAQVLITEAVAELPRTGIRAVLQTIADQAQAITGADYAALGIDGDAEKPFDIWVYSGMAPEQAAAIARLPRPSGVLGAVPRSGRPLRLRDVREHADFGGFPPCHPPMTSFLGVPIRYRGETLGNVYLCNKRGAEEFTAEDEQSIETLATRVAVILEIARLSEAEAMQRAWLQEVIDQMPEAVLVIDAAGRLTVNRAAVALSCGDTGRVDMFGNPILFDARLPTGEPAALDELLLARALVQRETVTSLELTLHGPGGPVPVVAGAAPIQQGARVRGAVAILQNVALLKEIERMREQWTSVIAHDLKQPLHSLALASQVLARLPSPGRAPVEQRAIARISSAAAKLERMVDDLLDMARIEAQKLKIERGDVELPALVEDLVDRMAPQLEGRPVQVEVVGEPRVVPADPVRLDQVLGNLLTNAIKYGSPGTAISVVLRFVDGETVEISVTNHGRGIPEADLPLIFDRFYRSRDSAASTVEGLGIGLYIVQGLVAAHGGRIWVESTPGETTTFRFTLPLR